MGAPLSLYLEEVSSRPTDRAVELSDGAFLTAGPLGVAKVATGTVTTLGPGPGEVRAMAVRGEAALVAGSQGLAVLEGDVLGTSPLGAALPGPPSRLLTVPGRVGLEVWLAGDGWLRLWRDGQVYTIAPGDLPLRAPELAFGAAAGGQSAVWVAAGGALYAIVAEADGTRAYPEVVDLPVGQLAVDARRTLWVVDASGQLRSRRADDRWRIHDAVHGVQAVAASPSSGQVWIQTMTELWRYDGTEFRRALDPPAGRPLGVASAGSLLWASANGLARLYGERSARFVGLREGGLLLATTSVELLPVAAATVRSVTATLDGGSIPISAAPYRVTLDPAVIADGVHQLVATVTYQDGAEVQGSLRFSHYEGPPPSWAADIEPLFLDRCALCHGERGSARRLDSATTWTEQIESILLNLRTRRMPLAPSAPFTEAELGLVEGWQAAGFPIQ